MLFVLPNLVTLASVFCGFNAICVVAQDNPYENLLIKGKVVEITTDGADDHIDQLARRYMEVDTYPLREPGEERVIAWIEPQRVKYDKY